MIRNETEYQEAVGRLEQERARLEQHGQHLLGLGLNNDDVKRALDPLRTFHLQLEDEVQGYERLKRGDVGELLNLHGLGRTLVALRIAKGLTQRELAGLLGVHESQVSRDERNEYHGITVERAAKILDAINVRMRSAFEQPVQRDVPVGADQTTAGRGIVTQKTTTTFTTLEEASRFVAAVEAGLADADAGRVHGSAAVVARVRKRLGSAT